MTAEEMREFTEERVSAAYKLAKQKLLKEFMDAEDEALNLLSDAMLQYTIATKYKGAGYYSVETSEEMKDYRTALESFKKHMSSFEGINDQLKSLERNEHEFMSNLPVYFDKDSYYSITQKYGKEIDELHEFFNELDD